MTGDSEAQSGSTEHQGGKEQVSSWIEKGIQEYSVAAYGTSVEEFLRMMKLGHISPSPINPKIPYQTDLTSGGRENLYFFVPILPAVQHFNSDLASKIEKQFYSAEQARTNLSVVESPKYASLYVEDKAVRDFLPDVDFSGVSVIRSGLQRAHDLNDYGGILDEWEDDIRHNSENKGLRETLEAKLDELRKKFKDPSFLQRIDDALRRQGVIIYFNKAIFEKGKALPGVEDEHEIIVVSDDPLDFSVIDGIEIMTDAEKEEVLSQV